MSVLAQYEPAAPEAEGEAEPEAEAEGEAEPEAEAEAEPEGEAEPEAEAEAEAEPEGEAEPEAEGKAEAEGEPEGEAEPEAEGEAEPEAEAEAEEGGELADAAADVSIVAADIVAAFDAEGVDAEAGAKLKDLFMAGWGEKPLEEEISLAAFKGMAGEWMGSTVAAEDAAAVADGGAEPEDEAEPEGESEPEGEPEPAAELTEEELEELARQKQETAEREERKRAMMAEKDRLDQLNQLYKTGLYERETIREANKTLHAKTIEHLHVLKKTDDVKEHDATFSEKSIADQQLTYDKILSVIDELRDELEKTQADNEDSILGLKENRDQKDGEASSLEKGFTDFKREVAEGAENSRTGKAIPAKLIEHFEGLEAEKEGEVEKVRLKNISHRTTLKKLEVALKKREELAVGLHLIDFEQLKIENQTLNEKIEEANENLLKLRKKTTTTVQVLTHVKEKLQFVQQEVSVQKNSLSQIDEAVTHHRDLLTHLKAERDKLRSSNQKLKQQSGLMNEDLLEDFEQRQEQAEILRERLQMIKDKHAGYTNFILAASMGGSQMGGPMDQM